jgi:hypothetical protein
MNHAMPDDPEKTLDSCSWGTYNDKAFSWKKGLTCTGT